MWTYFSFLQGFVTTYTLIVNYKGFSATETESQKTSVSFSSSFLRLLFSSGNCEWLMVHSRFVWDAGKIWFHLRVHRTPHTGEQESFSTPSGLLQRPKCSWKEAGSLLCLNANKKAAFLPQIYMIGAITFSVSVLKIDFPFYTNITRVKLMIPI